MRFARIAEHCNTCDQIGGLLAFPVDGLVNIVWLDAIDRRLRLTLDQAPWLMREGQMIFSLWYGVDRIFHLSFCLSTEEGKRVAYIGCLQGRNEVDELGHRLDVLSIYRDFTHASFGIRPRDFMVETFRMLCTTLSVEEIRAVSDLNHPQRLTSGDVKLSYDEVWRERGGVDNGNGFFILPLHANRRSAEEIPAKKRSMYRKRYALLDAIERDIVDASRRPPDIEDRRKPDPGETGSA